MNFICAKSQGFQDVNLRAADESLLPKTGT